MIPTFLPENTPDGEIEVFNKLKNEAATHDWIVLHSYFLEDHNVQISGEVDFIIFIPHRGIVVVEVKSHRIVEYDSGWTHGRNKEKLRDPFRQANDNMHTLIKRLTNDDKVSKQVKNSLFTNVVIFPKAKFKNLKEYNEWRLCDRDQFNGGTISDFILNAVEKETAHLLESENKIDKTNQKGLTKKTLLDTIQTLRPKLLVSTENTSQRNSRILEELEEFTIEQKNTLLELESNPKALIKGGAGTGKTALAMEVCDISAQNNKKAIYLCFNNNLMRFLKKKYGHLDFEISTYHGFLEQFTNTKRPIDESELEEYYTRTLPQLAYDNIADLDEKYDTVVVDEFQDLISQENLIILSSLVKGGLIGGNWVFLGDFTNQSIYNKNFNLEEIFTEYLGYMPPVKIFNINCRNTPTTVDQLYKWTNTEKYHQVLRPNNSLVSYFPDLSFNDDEFQIISMSKVLDRLLADGYSPSEILFLTPFNNSIIESFNNNQSKYFISKFDINSDNGPNGPYHTTIASFKGLEFNVVIMTDLKHDINPDKKEIRKLMYTGISRSLDLTVMIADDILFKGLDD